MTIFNLNGPPKVIAAMQNAANGVVPASDFDISVDGGHVRTNSNTGPEETKQRLEEAGFKVSEETYSRDGKEVIELAASAPDPTQ